MNVEILLTNLTNPTLLFFILGLVAVIVKSDLEIPQQSIKFISIYLLFAIGFKGGQALVNENFDLEVLKIVIFALTLSSLIPILAFYLIKKFVSIENAGAIAAAYGSVSAVTFVAASTFLELKSIEYSGFMVAIMALMEAPAIIVGVALIQFYNLKHQTRKESGQESHTSLTSILKHSVTNGSVLMIVGSLVIGVLSDNKQAEGIKPFTNDIFKGFLAIFLLEMGMTTAKRMKSIKEYGLTVITFALIFPLIVGICTAYLSSYVTDSSGDRFMMAILASSASYIAVPASMRIAVPKADPGLYITMALGLTFPMNLTIGMPIYFSIINF